MGLNFKPPRGAFQPSPLVASGIVVIQADKDYEELTMTWLLINILLVVPFVALWVGIPMWLVLRGPDTHPNLSAAPPIRPLPAQPHEDAHYRRVALPRVRAPDRPCGRARDRIRSFRVGG